MKYLSDILADCIIYESDYSNNKYSFYLNDSKISALLYNTNFYMKIKGPEACYKELSNAYHLDGYWFDFYVPALNKIKELPGWKEIVERLEKERLIREIIE